MSCIKTGAVVYVENYKATVVCDLFQVANCIIMKYQPNTLYSAAFDRELVTHELFVNGRDFMRKDLGLIVAPADSFKLINGATDFRKETS